MWFKTDATGLNAVPTLGRNWAAIGLYAAFLLVWTLIIFLGVGASPTGMTVYVVVVLVMSAIFVWLVFQRTEGE